MRKLLLTLLLIGATASRAEAVTLRDLVDLARQGMSDDLLIALVEAEKSVFHLSVADVKQLKQQGLSDRLLIHLLQTPSLRPAPEPTLHIADTRRPPSVAAADVVVIDRVETVAVPVYVPVPAPAHHRRHERDRDRGHDGGVDDGDRKKREPEKPVYWGYGGKLRPGSWKDR